MSVHNNQPGHGLEEDSAPLDAVDNSPPLVESTVVTPVAFEAAPGVVEIDVDSEVSNDDASAVEEAVRQRRVFGVNPHAELTSQVKARLKPGTVLGENDALSILPTDPLELNTLADGYPNTMELERTVEGQRWIEEVEQAQRYFMRGNAMLSALTREGTYWRQTVTGPGSEQLGIGRPKFGDSEGEKLSGDKAMMRLQAVLGLGATVRVPLWHSGIWVTLKAPTEAALLELDRRMGSEKIALGRQSNGMVFANTSVYVTSYLVNFALDHVYDATVKYNETANLKEIIKVTDIPTLLWGLICAIYPNGYPFRQPCVTDPSKCTHITEELLNISKLSWTDDRKLSEFQRKLMLRKLSKFTEAELARYEEEHEFTKYATVHLRDNLAMELKVPTIAEYEASGFEWVDSIVAATDRVFAGSMSAKERNDYILQQGQVTALRQYAHWIRKLVITQPDKQEIIEDTATIADNIGTLTAADDIFEKFFEGIGQFIDNTTVSLIALPKYDCPECGSPMASEEEKHPYLIVLDVAQVFFTLQGHRIFKALQRSRA